jgi:hypothetical protein
MAQFNKITFTKEQKKFIDSLVKNAYIQGHNDGFSVSGKHFNGISGMLDSVDFKEITQTQADHYMVSNEEFFSQFYKIK